MADYYPLVAKAVAGLEKNTGEGRRMLYERARSALVAQLRGMNDPPLTEAEITRERLALEEAIRKVEAEAARRGRDAPRPESPVPTAPAAPRAEAEPASSPPARPAPASSADRAARSGRSEVPPEPPVNWAEPDRIEPRAGQQRQGPMRQPSADDIDDLPRGSRVGLIAAILVVLLIIGLGVAAYWQRDRIAQ